MDRRRLLRWLGAGPLAIAAVGCGGAPSRSRYDVMRVPDERTARAWIGRAFKREGFAIEQGRIVKIGKDATIEVDVAANGAPWGVVWLRADEQQALAGKLPAPPAGVSSGALWVHPGIDDDAEQRMLILLEKGFEYDPDPRGEGGVVRSIEEVEARCVRDVTDFLVRAKAGELG
jgi:hypothetical protein